jgi:hypothetical protein
MKTTKVLSVVILTITAVFARNACSQVQIYQFTEPISGYLTMSAQDLNATPGCSGVFSNSFNTLSETIYLDPVGETLRQVGTISYTPSGTNIQFQDTQVYNIKKIFELRLFSGSYFCTRPYVKPAGVAALAAYNAICRQAPQTTPPEAEVFRLEMAETTVRPL